MFVMTSRVQISGRQVGRKKKMDHKMMGDKVKSLYEHAKVSGIES